MPSSSPEVIPVVIGLLWELAPRSVLDIGTGYGKYGVLFREYLELRHRQVRERNHEADPTRLNRLVQIDGVEGFADYVGDLHRAVYDNMYIENILDFAKREWEYDLIFMADVLEHMDKEVALKELLPKLVLAAKMGVLISVPAKVQEQHAEFNNELEIHRSQWNYRDFHKLAPFTHTGLKAGHLISFLTREHRYYRIARGNVLRRKLRSVKRAFQDSW